MQSISHPIGSRSLIIGGLRLPADPTASSRTIAERVADAVDALTGPGSVILAGDVFELAPAIPPDCGPALARHPRLTAALERYGADEGRSVVVLLGESESALAHDRTGRRHLDERGWIVSDQAIITCETSGGPRSVLIEPIAGPPRHDNDRPHWSEGVDRLEVPSDAASFVAARWWGHVGGVPTLVGAMLISITIALVTGRIGVALIAGALVIAAAVGWSGRVGRHAAGPDAAGLEWEADPDGPARGHGLSVLERGDGLQGYVGAGSLRPEITSIDGGRFVALSGSATDILIRRNARVGLPAFTLVRQLAWLELDGGSELTARLIVGRSRCPGRPGFGMFLRRRDVHSIGAPRVVAAVPARWGSPDRFSFLDRRLLSPFSRTRRVAAAATAIVAGIDLLSAATPPFHDRVQFMHDLVPTFVPTAAAVVAAAVGIGLAAAAHELRRGRRRAWILTVALCLAAAAGHLLKGLDIEEAAVSLALVGWLVVHRSAFAVEWRRRPTAMAPDAAERAREIVALHGSDTLAYFALRDDKRWFFSGESMVAYAVHHGVCLVSPDPIGPADQRAAVWTEFCRFAHGRGWRVAVIGASAEWLPNYHAMNMREVYLGDEAIVDVRAFSMDGTANKSLRHTVNKVRKNGYRVEFLDPSKLDEDLRRELLDLMADSRRGDEERGFSMTLGRLFDSNDRGLLLAVVIGPDGLPAAFCQYAPASGINGYSLDVMRRRSSDRTNGLIDFVVVETIVHLRTLGFGGLGLNFATLRTVVSGEHDDTLLSRVERWAINRMGDSMQIESLWHYNEKFRPQWRPRYAVVEGYDQLLSASLALARAESWWELPVIGRFMASRSPSELS